MAWPHGTGPIITLGDKMGFFNKINNNTIVGKNLSHDHTVCIRKAKGMPWERIAFCI